jgi:hypothetical protein
VDTLVSEVAPGTIIANSENWITSAIEQGVIVSDQMITTNGVYRIHDHGAVTQDLRSI